MECSYNHNSVADGEFCPECGQKIAAKVSQNESLDTGSDSLKKLKSSAEKLANTSKVLMTVFNVLGILSIVGGVILCFITSSSDVPYTDIFGNASSTTVSSHPFIAFGIAAAIAGVLEALVFATIFRYISFQATYRSYQLGEFSKRKN
jgi:hypothetical protein